MSATNHLEPRVAKLEGQLSALAKDLSDLSGIVREFAKGASVQFQAITGRLAEISGPRPTNWQVIIAGATLMMAIGYASFAPVWMRLADMESHAIKLDSELAGHRALELHPVGMERINKLESELRNRVLDLTTEIKKIEEQGTSPLRERIIMLESKLPKP